ncbi:glycosyltransferase family 2 protein [Aequorivita lipolytica]|uniref:Glycosyltransferase family 2 protein n=1 Tax=Aequorivita lipolytica TaxID=153267 RepID=A0A5C6YNM2_9FLAO|nr:glycosyltransferase family 2 protein [Aequorivita lipolytica]TXD68795.1 glycosyltransferase family 2 protein [Aequorivita lipolytica]SRX52044.1 hypothetical protein AEQU2_02025 [Aequorivita lipolytica]
MFSFYTVIVTYNGRRWIDKCIDSLYESSFQNNIIIVDNNSVDNTVSYIKRKYTDIYVLAQEQNLGFGKANNLGISYALQKGADFIFLLNQDAMIKKNTLEKLIKVSNDYPEYGVLSPFHLDWDGSKLEYYFSKFTLKNIELYSDYVLQKELKLLYEVPFINAAAWLVPRKTFEAVGGFDPIFHHYGEDNNYCQRLNFHKIKIGVVTGSFIFHDSKKRREPPNYLFSEAYYLDEVKKLQIKYANINDHYSERALNNELKHINKLILINAFKLNNRAICGYLKKYRIFKKNIEIIAQSRKQNIVKKPNYLNL